MHTSMVFVSATVCMLSGDCRDVVPTTTFIRTAKSAEAARPQGEPSKAQ